jgi:vinculin
MGSYVWAHMYGFRCHVHGYSTDVYNCALQVSREVGGREKELTHQVHREILVRCLEQVKTLAPILICSMKIFIHIIAQGL